jgi:hypothetical protein
MGPLGPLDFEVLLDLVEDLEREMDRYLTDFSSSSKAIPRIIDTCRRMRTELESAWLETVTSNQRRAMR